MGFTPEQIKGRITRNCVLWMSLWTMATPARTLNGLRSKTCSGNWNKGPSTVFW